VKTEKVKIGNLSFFGSLTLFLFLQKRKPVLKEKNAPKEEKCVV